MVLKGAITGLAIDKKTKRQTEELQPQVSSLNMDPTQGPVDVGQASRSSIPSPDSLAALPSPEPEPTKRLDPYKDLTPGELQAYRQNVGYGGAFTGVKTTPDLTPRVQELLAQTQGTREFQQAQQAQQMEAQQQAAGQLGQVTPGQEAQGFQGNYRQAALVGGLAAIGSGATAGAAKVLFGGAIAAGAAKGAVAGSLAGPGGAIAFGLIGAGIGFVAAAGANIRSQKSGTESGLRRNAQSNERIMREAVAFMNLDPDNSQQYVGMFNEAKSKMIADYGELNLLTGSNLALALGRDGTATKMRYEHMLGSNGMVDALEQKARISLGQPNPEAGMMMLSGMNIGGEE